MHYEYAPKGTCSRKMIFDIDGDTIYILTVDQIQVYSKKGDWIRSIPLSLNASGLRITANNMLLFVLSDKYIVHVFDKDGNEKCIGKESST